jgi:hypothetical protein
LNLVERLALCIHLEPVEMGASCPILAEYQYNVLQVPDHLSGVELYFVLKDATGQKRTTVEKKDERQTHAPVWM